MDRDTPITELKGVGEKTARLFGKLDIRTVGELLAAYPRDYEVFGEPVKIGRAASGEVCAVQGAVSGIPNERRIRNLSILNVVIADESGRLQLTFYNMPFLKKTLRQGGFYIFRGLVRAKGAVPVMEQPKIFSPADYDRLMNRLVPRYALTKGLTNQAVQKYVRQALSLYAFEPEYYDPALLEENQLVSWREAVETVHFPDDRDSLILSLIHI